MPNNKKQRPPIDYTSRDFESIKKDLISYAKRYYGDNVKDFNKASVNSFFVDTVSYVGDILSHYLDYSVNESNPDSAFEPRNLVRHGKFRGYKFNRNPSSHGIATFFISVVANTSGIGPNEDYIPVLRKGTELETVSGNSFILNEDVNFADPNNEVVVATVDDNTGQPLTYAIKAYGRVISGKIDQDTITVGPYTKFPRIKLNDANIAEILSVVDSEGHDYFEVNYLSQDVIYKPILNRDEATKNEVKNILKPHPVPRRYVVEHEVNNTYLQFGYGNSNELSSTEITDPSTTVMNLHGKNYITDESFDPQKLIESDKFGLAPADTNLTITYRLNTSDSVNAASDSITIVTRAFFDFVNEPSLNADLVRQTKSSIAVTNEEYIMGDVSFPSSNELRRKMIDSHATQNRAVTKNDYISIIYRMPPQFGAIKRATILQDENSFKRNLNLYVVSESTSGILIKTNNIIKENLKVWLSDYKMINDTVDILDARIVNLGINFSVTSTIDANLFDLLPRCILALQLKFIDVFDIGEPFLIEDVYKTLNAVDGVSDTTRVDIVEKVGGLYSTSRFNILQNTSPNGKYILPPEDVVFEIRYPSVDIQGEII